LVILNRPPSLTTLFPLNQTTSGIGSPDTEQLKRTIPVASARFDRSLEVNDGAASNRFFRFDDTDDDRVSSEQTEEA